MTLNVAVAAGAALWCTGALSGVVGATTDVYIETIQICGDTNTDTAIYEQQGEGGQYCKKVRLHARFDIAFSRYDAKSRA